MDWGRWRHDILWELIIGGYRIAFMPRPATKATATWVVRRLVAGGHRALFAGGCVRDMLLGRRCTDYDVATDATPQQVKGMFGHVLLIGAKFGVAMVLHRGRKVEVTTFRSDWSYSDGRRPDGVRYTTPQEDAKRRDFTINGIFYDPLADEVIDYVKGQADLAAGTVRTIGRPDERFAEDYLRMLRAVRFAVALDFSIERRTASGIRKYAAKVTSMSGERIFDELSKMLSLGSAADALVTMAKLGLARQILPELFAGEGLWEAAVHRTKALAGRRDLTLVLAGVLAELPPRRIVRIIRRWGASNNLRDELCFLARHLDDWQTACEVPLAEFKRLLGGPYFGRLRRLWSLRERLATGRSSCARRITRRVRQIPADRVAPPPLVTGSDLLAMGLEEGPRFGRVLAALYDAQLNETLATRRAALRAARERIRRAKT